MEEYNQNADFKEYVDKYCQREHITPEVAVTHAIRALRKSTKITE